MSLPAIFRGITLALTILACIPLCAADELRELLRQTKIATMQGRWQEATQQLDNAIRARKTAPAEVALLAAERGRVALEQHFYFRQDEAGAEALIRQSLEAAEKHRLVRAEAIATLQMARLAYTQARAANANWELALQFASRSITLWEKLGQTGEVANAIFIVGLVHQMRDGREHGLEQFERALKLAEASGDKEAMANAERHIGYVYEAKKDYPRALRHYERSLKLREEAGARVNVPFALITLADLHWKSGIEKRRALELLERAVEEAQHSNSVRAQYTACLSLARYLKELGGTTRALEHARLALEGTRAYAATTAGKTAQELIDSLK